MEPLKMYFLLKMVIFHCYVRLPQRVPCFFSRGPCFALVVFSLFLVWGRGLVWIKMLFVAVRKKILWVGMRLAYGATCRFSWGFWNKFLIAQLMAESHSGVGPGLLLVWKYWSTDTDVSENSGTPKSSTLIGFSIINHPFWGTAIFGNTYTLMTLKTPAGSTKTCHVWFMEVIFELVISLWA